MGTTEPSSSTDPYAETVRLSLATGSEVEAWVPTRDGSPRPKCLLLHGNPGSLLDWEHVVPALSEAVDLVALDMPGFGKSPRPGFDRAALSLDRLAEHAVAVADALSWREPFHIVGHSHGGGVAQVAAARYPERIAGIVLIGTLGAPAHGTYRLLSLMGAETIARLTGAMIRARPLRPMTRAILHQVMRDIFHPEPVSPERIEKELSVFSLRPEILVSMVHVTLGRPCEKLLHSAADIRCPTLFVHGADDALVPTDCARTIHERITNAGGHSRFEALPNAGHMLIEHRAREVAELVRRHVGC